MSLAKHGNKNKSAFEKVATQRNSPVNVMNPSSTKPEGNTSTEVSTKTSTETRGDTVPSTKELLSAVAKKTKKGKIQRSVYLDEDVCKAFDNFGEKHSGQKSELVNELLRVALADYM